MSLDICPTNDYNTVVSEASVPCACVYGIAQVCGQPLWLLLCPFIIAQLMDLFEVWPQLNLAGDGTTYSQLGKCCSIGTPPRLTCQ